MDLADGGDLSSTIDRLRVQGVRDLLVYCRLKRLEPTLRSI